MGITPSSETRLTVPAADGKLRIPDPGCYFVHILSRADGALKDVSDVCRTEEEAQH